MTNITRVQWSEQEPVLEASSADELGRILDQVGLHASWEAPTIVFVEAHDYRVLVGLGCKKSFLQFEPESGDPPYLVTVGDAGAQGLVAFYLFGNHHTEIPRRYLIPAARAREVLKEWIQTAVRPSSLEWDEI
jgi:hypothetical protein